jgi:arabinogalactan endo-1,4-beta-galactosidase
MKGFISLLKEAARAVRDTAGKDLQIVIHLADGGDNNLYRYVFDELAGAKVDFDIIGLSFYPYWHGSLDALNANLRDITKRYKKPAIIAETAYGFTTEDGDSQGNVFKVFDDGTSGYLPTVQGQATMVRDLIAVVAGVPDARGLGVFYWEPGWIPVERAGWRTGEGANWENQAMFDFNGKALASLDVWNAVYAGSGGAPVPKSAEPVTMKTAPGEKKPLPSTVRLYYTDDSIRSAPVTWEPFTVPSTEGAFTVNGKASGLAVSANITVSNQINLVEDPSFENGTIKGWVLNGPSEASFAENNKANAHTGNWTYKYWLDRPFRSILSKTFTKIPDGTYTLSIWAMGGGGENTIKLFARDAANKTLSITIRNTGWQEWKQYVLPAVQVSGGTCTIGIFIDAKAENWGNFDDIEFFKN